MKKFIFESLFIVVAVPALAAPATNVSVSHPTTTGAKVAPRTNVVVSHTTTQTAVSHPTTQVAVTHPTTAPTLQKANHVGGNVGSKSGGGSYNASYKNAKTLAPTPSANTPKAAKLGKGQNGLGTGAGSEAAAKDAAAAAAKPKAESSQLSIDEVLKKTNVPGDLGSKLKQMNFAAEKGASAGKKK